MLTYCYALVSHPCERTLDDLFGYVRAHPGCLLALKPEDARALDSAIETASSNDRREQLLESDELTLARRFPH